MTTSSVKSWTYTTPTYPTTLVLSTTTVPSSPLPNHILVQIHAAALNPVDIQFMNVPLNALPGLKSTKIPARDFSGTVLAASPNTSFTKGDEVMGFTPDFAGTGGLTEVAHVNLAKACVIKKPGNMTWVQAASLPLVWLTARTSVERCVPFVKEAGERKVAILGGSSGVGIYTIMIAKQRGWKVLTSCSGRNVEFVKGLGADEVVDYTVSPTAVVDKVREWKGDAIIDCVGGTACIGLARQYVTIVGDKTSRSSMGGSAIYITNPQMVLRWFLGYIGLGNSYECINLEAKKEWLEECTALKGEQIVVDSTFEFEKAKEAYERLNTSRARGKVVVEIKS